MLGHDHIIITSTDLERLQPVLASAESRAAELLDLELHRARVVDPRAVPPDVVTMNSEVVYEDLHTGVQRTVRIVYPRDADARTNRISVLAPIGSALLGLQAGQMIAWQVPNGTKRIRVVAVRYQPEAAGDFQL